MLSYNVVTLWCSSTSCDLEELCQDPEVKMTLLEGLLQERIDTKIVACSCGFPWSVKFKFIMHENSTCILLNCYQELEAYHIFLNGYLAH